MRCCNAVHLVFALPFASRAHLDDRNSADYVTLPAGRNAHKSCVYSWPHGTQIGTSHATMLNGTVIPIASCDKPSDNSYDGWVESAYDFATDAKGLSYFRANFNVPEKPKPGSADEVTFVFNSMKDANNEFIIQPVLTYTNSAQWTAGTACYPDRTGEWEFRSWFVDNKGNTHCGEGMPVQVGDTVTGTMKLLEEGKWRIWSGMSNLGYSLDISHSLPQMSAQVALEVHDTSSTADCSTFPGSVVFSEITLQQHNGDAIYDDLSPSWAPQFDGNAPQCGQNVKPDASGGVTISTGLDSDGVALV